MRRLALILCLCSLALTVVVGCATQPTVDIDGKKKIAGELRNNKLYSAAIEEYKNILDVASLDTQQRGNINYLIAKIYFEDIQDYSSAAAYYIRARTIDPNGSYVEEASRNLVASLEKMGQTIDAARELRVATNIDSVESKPGDVLVAQVGDRRFYMAEIEDRIQSLPPSMQKQLADRASRVNFVRQLAGVELLYRAAVREGYDQKTDIRKAMDDYERSVIVDRFLADKVMNDMKVDSLDVRTYYQAHRDDRYDGRPYDSVRAQVFMDYQNDKAEVAYNEYLQKLARAEQFQLYEKNIR